MALEKPAFTTTKKDKLKPELKDIAVGDVRYEAVLSANRLCGHLFSGLEPTSLPPLRLRILLEKLANPNISDGEIYEKNKAFAEHLSKREAEFMRPGNPLPTIGIEIEIPNQNFLSVYRDMLDNIGIPNVSETEEKHEMSPNFSYSPWVQARMLQEISSLGIVPLKKVNGKEVVDPDVPLSLHINFGIPNVIDWEKIREKYRNIDENEHPQLLLINDLLTYAFSSPNRLKNRKSFYALHYNKGASKTIKDTGPSPFIYRVELRTNEFKDYPTYRLLAESQRIMGMFFAYTKKKEGLKCTEVEEKLAVLWVSFYREARRYLYKEEDLDVNLFDKHAYGAADTLERNPELRKNCRALVTKYSQKVAKLLNIPEDREEN